MVGLDIEGTELLLVRHGETEWNLQKRWQGRENSPLTLVGVEAAIRLGRRLRGAGICAVYTSPLGRAAATAKLVANSLELAPVECTDVIERAYGVFEGRTLEQAREMYPAEYARNRQREWDYALPGGGESRADAAERGRRALLRIAEAHPGGRVLVVLHSGLLAAIMSSVLGLSPQPNADIRALALPNTAINMLRWKGSGWTLVLWGDTGEFEAHRRGGVTPGASPLATSRRIAELVTVAAAGVAVGIWLHSHRSIRGPPFGNLVRSFFL